MLTPRVERRRRLRVVLALTSLLGLGLAAVPPSASASSAPYVFEQTQSGRSAQPVGWNPCRTIPVRVNLTRAPRGSMQLVQQALSQITAASGLRLVVVGRSHRTRGFLHHYGVLIAWTSPKHERALAGRTVGLGSTSWRQRSGGMRHYTRGAALIDAPAARHMGQTRRLAVLEHELGHVMGLGHVRDPHELMYPVIRHQGGYQAGDLEGLAVLGHLPCS